jgi:two-component system chemotaxis sensor kinase CheA
MNEQELLKMLRAAFKEEADERLVSLSNCLLQLERLAPDAVAGSEALEVAFREAHSLKGAARSVSLLDIETLFQHMESVLAKMKRGELTLELHNFDVLHECVAQLEIFLSSFSVDADISCADQVAVLVEKLDGLVSNATNTTASQGSSPAADPSGVESSEVAVPTAPPHELNSSPAAKTATDIDADAQPVSADINQSAPLLTPVKAASTAGAPTVASDAILRVASERIDNIMCQAEGMIALKLQANQRALEAQKLSYQFSLLKKNGKEVNEKWRASKKRVESLTLAECQLTIGQLLEYVEQNQRQIKTIAADFSSFDRCLAHDVKLVDTMVDELLDDVMAMIMVPFSNASASLPRMVREIARTQNKQVDLVINGAEVELDKRILDKLTSPLTHLLRNAIDHGIELPAHRVAAGKAATAQVVIALGHLKSGQVEISITDDGAGIDAQKLRAKVVKQGLMSADQVSRLSDEAAVELIFSSGISTSAILTEISGRGLGMAIVKTEVENLGGHVHVVTNVGQGTCFKLHLPVSLSLFRGILINVRGYNFILPTTAVERVMKVARSSIKTLENRSVISLDGGSLAVVELGDVLSLIEKPIMHGKDVQIAVVHDTDQRLGFIVDAVDGEYELLVKGLGHNLRGLRFFSGASVLGDGRIVPILNQHDLLNSIKDGVTFTVRDESQSVVKTILAVDDSITSRMLIKNILEASGYKVVSAVDGVDAYAKLTAASFDLVVSDVEMPRMDGFELTARIRETDSVANIPVILVTSLESGADKEKGVIAGANAYIVKRSFDQSNLLETVKRLI